VEVVNDGKVAAQVHEPACCCTRARSRTASSPKNDAGRTSPAPTCGSRGVSHPIAAALLAFVCLPLSQIEGAQDVLTLLFDEAFAQRCGRQALLDRLFEVVLIQILRHLMEHGHVSRAARRSVASAFAPRAGGDARTAGSRVDAGGTGRHRRHVAHPVCHQVVGVTPGQYLQNWRISLLFDWPCTSP
jgi:hypothetical protein